jgi:hypothetical protein
MNLQGLLYIDYFFHLPLEIAGVALALCFISLMRNRPVKDPQPAEPTQAEGSPVVAQQ